MKKNFLLSILVLIFLISCGGEKKGSQTGGKGEKVVLKVGAWNDAGDALKKVATEFEKTHPDVKIEIIESDSNYTKLTPALVSNQGAPDIIQAQARDFQSFLIKFPKQFYDLTEKMQKDGLADKFLPASIENVKGNGKIYAMPWDIGPTALYYRKDMFEKANIDPKSIETWDDFIEAGKKIQAANPGVNMTGYSEDNDFFHMLFNQLGGTYVKDNKISVNSPEAVKAFELMKKMQTANILINVKDWNGRIIALNNSKIATVIFPVWYSGTLVNAVADQKGKWGLIELPAFEKGGNRQANLGGSVLIISEQSKNKEIAYEFLKFALATVEGEDIMMEFGLFPAYTPYYSAPSFKVNNEYFGGMDINTFFAGLTNTIPEINYGAIMLDAQTPLNNMTTSVMGGKDINTALKEASTAISQSTQLEEAK